MDGYVGERSLPGLRVSIDPAHGGIDRGFRGRRDEREGRQPGAGPGLAALLEDPGRW